MQQHQETIKHIIDVASISVWVGALMQVLPAIAAFISIIWGCIRIYETHTVQRWLGKPHRRKSDPPKEKHFTDCKYKDVCLATECPDCSRKKK